MKRVVNFEIKVRIQAEYEPKEGLYLEDVLETAKGLVFNGINKHTIVSGVKLKEASEGSRPAIKDVRVRTFSNEEGWYIDEPYFDRYCQSEIEIEELIKRHKETHNGAEPYKVEITFEKLKE